MLQEDVMAYLTRQVRKATADPAQKMLLDAEPELPLPKSYLLLRKLRMYGGKAGATPFYLAGGYVNQPFLISLCLEACMEAELRFQDNLQTAAESLAQAKAKSDDRSE